MAFLNSISLQRLRKAQKGPARPSCPVAPARPSCPTKPQSLRIVRTDVISSTGTHCHPTRTLALVTCTKHATHTVYQPPSAVATAAYRHLCLLLYFPYHFLFTFHFSLKVCRSSALYASTLPSLRCASRSNSSSPCSAPHWPP